MAVFLSNVSDYIEPSMNCVNPLKIGEASTVALDDKASNDVGSLKDGSSKQKVSLSYEGQDAPKPVVASISLSDCLSCSGCITSTESVLVDAQSTSSLSDAVGRGEYVCFLLSASSVVELQRHWEAVADKDLGRRAVSAFVRERLSEFSEGRCVILASDNSGVRRVWADASYDEFRARFDTGSAPVLAGHCPGLVCYAEKSAHDLVDTLSAIRSPTMISAKLARGALGEGRVFLTAVEPCYDKKLEVTRSVYMDEAAKVRRQAKRRAEKARYLRPTNPLSPSQLNDVDLVLTSSELRKLLESGVPNVLQRISELQDLGASDAVAVAPELASLSLERACFLGRSKLGSGSGGLAELMLRRFAAERYGLTEWLDFELAVPWGRESSGVRRRKRGTNGVLEAWICERNGGKAFVSGPGESVHER